MACRWHRAVFTSLLVMASVACSDDIVDRAGLNADARRVELASTLSVSVQGAAITAHSRAVGDCPASVEVRAQSFDVRLDVRDTGCQPRAVHVTVTHLPRGELARTARPFIGAVDPVVGALLGAAGGGLAIGTDPHDPRWTPLAVEAAFEARTDAVPTTAGITDRWTVCTDRNRQDVTLLPGHLPAEACVPGSTVTEPVACDPTAEAPSLVDDGAGACVTFGATDDALGTAPLIARHRLRLPLTPDDCLRFATWGNNRAAAGTREAIMAAVAETDAQFVVVTGDMTSEGNTAQLRAARDALDAELQIPWYATLGDVEAEGPVADNFTQLIGASTFAFDAGPTRVVALDSGDRGLFSDDRRALYRWLSPTRELWWSAEPPPARLVLTHVPPFDPSGARSDAFRHRPEAAAMVAALQRGSVPFLLSSQFAVYDRHQVGSTTVIHAGGAGAPMETGQGDPHHWLLVTVEPGCDDPPPCVAPEGGCPCVRVDRVDVGAAPPALDECRPAAAQVTE